jgi:DNA invertase Pin-like site-specific DNA recombinase
MRSALGRNARGLEVVLQLHELNRSGGTIDRPVFNAITERVRNGRSGGIVVYKTERFARTLLGAVNTLAKLDWAQITHDASRPQLGSPS